MRLRLYVVLTATLLFGAPHAYARAEGDVADPLPKLTLPSEPMSPREKLSLGINYIGGQCRYGFTNKWAVELRMQFGEADSDYGKVRATTVGFRGYYFFKNEARYSLYVGPEIARVGADSADYNYGTEGMAMGVFGGFHYRLTKRFSLDTDIGPYVIALKEKTSDKSSTNLDFVLNTALVYRIF